MPLPSPRESCKGNNERITASRAALASTSHVAGGSISSNWECHLAVVPRSVMNRQRFMSGLRAKGLAVAAGLWSLIHFPLRSISVVVDHSLGDYFRRSASFPRLSPADRGTFHKVFGRLMAALAAAVAPFSLSPHGFQWIIFHTFRAGPDRAQRRRLASPAFAPPSGPCRTAGRPPLHSRIFLFP